MITGEWGGQQVASGVWSTRVWPVPVPTWSGDTSHHPYPSGDSTGSALVKLTRSTGWTGPPAVNASLDRHHTSTCRVPSAERAADVPNAIRAVLPAA